MTLKYYNASTINQVMVPSLKIQSTLSIRALTHFVNDINLEMVAFITQYFSQRFVILIEILYLSAAIRKHWVSLKITIKIKKSICRKFGIFIFCIHFSILVLYSKYFCSRLSQYLPKFIYYKRLISNYTLFCCVCLGGCSLIH